MLIRKEDALEYHSTPTAGKLAVTPTKPCRTQRDLSLAYTPGVAVPCLEIERDPSLAYKYTAKGNLVAVVSNGTAVLGLGNIGALAGKPVMEGKAVLFKRFADIDVFDIELATENPSEVIRACQLLKPTFGGINLEDIKAPECFEIEEELKRTMKIPVFHDDQHGTAIISGAALLNALELVGKPIGEVKLVFSGAGAAAVSCAEHYIRLGLKRENITMCDTKGVLYQGRTAGLNKYKARFAKETSARTLADALRGADVFVGLSSGNCVTPEMLMGMANDPHRVRDGQPGSGDSLRRGGQGASRHHHVHGPLGLSQPGEQRPRLPVHFPRSAGRARHGHQRRDEAGRHPRPGRPGQGGRAGFGPRRLRRRPDGVRPRVHHPQAVRSARCELARFNPSTVDLTTHEQRAKTHAASCTLQKEWTQLLIRAEVANDG